MRIWIIAPFYGVPSLLVSALGPMSSAFQANSSRFPEQTPKEMGFSALSEDLRGYRHLFNPTQ